MKIFKINGYWADDRTEFENYLVAELDSTPDGYRDEDIFFYGLSERAIQEAIKNGESIHDFIITSYEEV